MSFDDNYIWYHCISQSFVRLNLNFFGILSLFLKFILICLLFLYCSLANSITIWKHIRLFLWHRDLIDVDLWVTGHPYNIVWSSVFFPVSGLFWLIYKVLFYWTMNQMMMGNFQDQRERVCRETSALVQKSHSCTHSLVLLEFSNFPSSLSVEPLYFYQR